MNRTLYTVAIVLMIAGRAHSAPTLLVEIGWENPTPLSPPATYWISAAQAGNAPQPRATSLWLDELVNLTQTLNATPTMVADWNETLAAGWPVLLGAQNGEQSCFECRFGVSFDYILGGDNGLWADGGAEFFGSTGVARVSQVGNALFGYELTAIEKHVTPTSQRLYFYGEAVPETATIILLCIASLHFST